MKRRAIAPPLPLDRSSNETLRDQLTRLLRAAIDSGAFAPEAPLPSTRELASSLGISRNTVVFAYEELVAEGRTAGRGGSATRVVARRAAPAPPDWTSMVRSSQYPVAPVRFRDAEGNALYFHR